MNQTRIEWTDETVNPVVGCTHNCVYCYAKRFAKRQGLNSCCYDFYPHPHLERLEKIKSTQKPKRIFIDSMWDWNCKDNKDEWYGPILEKMKECNQHTFQILSKRPRGYAKFKFPENVWLGTTITNDKDSHHIDELVKSNSGNLKFVSIEPIHSKINHDFSGLDWIILGAETGNRKEKIIPEREWLKDIIGRCKQMNLPLFIKNNVKWDKTIRQFPD